MHWPHARNLENIKSTLYKPESMVLRSMPEHCIPKKTLYPEVKLLYESEIFSCLKNIKHDYRAEIIMPYDSYATQ